jgi:IS30 family transposase
MTHGGARKGAGRPPKDIHVSRVYALHDAGVSVRAIARKFNVSPPAITRLIRIRNGRLYNVVAS